MKGSLTRSTTGEWVVRLCDSGFGAIERVRRWLGCSRVETISTPDLHSQMTRDASSPVLVDVRSRAELSVSRIPGAITQAEYESDADSLAGRPVVVYCTVGGRSYLYARKLVAAGINAVNYRDGILGWCRAELPLESPDKQSRGVKILERSFWPVKPAVTWLDGGRFWVEIEYSQSAAG